MERGWLRRGHHLILWCLIAGILALAGQLTVQAGPEPEVVITSKAVTYETELLAGEVRVPVIAGLSDSELEGFLNSQWEMEIKEFVEAIGVEAEAFRRELGEESKHWLPFQAYVDFRIGYLDERFVSVPMVYYCYTGGAHGMSFQVSTNIDLAEGTRLNLEDLFLPGYDWAGAITEEVNRQRAANADYYFDETMAETVILSDHPFYLTAQGVVVYFGLYEIAPYSTGIPEFVVLYEYLWEGLKTEIQAIAEVK